ncbi:ABC transporter ATP-binding protein/permease [Actinoplanes hulinensis]|uniref:ABC transporter ATP-binding protein/permease n=1 Tax=Actinoplanes hulinensis TaxID=1144547 RepID=A0ABS7B9C7_9ACTN|nr:ABC transporter ATP-binding protein [Actinoplanes hulinensis]MBW6437241.1 ABC transporter ATP-binding protein/permease [Actinoplanes hulinensis]
MTAGNVRPDLDIPVRAAVRAAVAFAARTTPARLLAQIVLSAVAGLTPMVTALAGKHLFDQLAAGRNAAALTAGAVLAGAMLVAACLPAGQRYLGREMERRLSLRASDELYRAVTSTVGIARLENPAFHDRVRLARQSGGDTPAVVTDALIAVARCLITMFGLLTALAALSPLLAGALLAVCVPVVVCHLALSRRRAAAMWTVSPAERREVFFSGLLVDLQAAKEIRLFGLGGFLRGRILAGRRSADRQYRRIDRGELGVQILASALSAGAAAAATLWTVQSVAAGGLTIGDVSLLLVSVSGLTMVGGELATALALANRHALVYRHYLAVVREPVDVPEVRAPAVAVPGAGIELRDVWFRYTETGPWILRGVDLNIPVGRATALVGANGAGKSTLVKLLCRFYDPTRGSITWDGVDLRAIPPADLRDRITAVFQDYMEYDLSAGENIGIGDIGSIGDTDRIRTAAENAGIGDTVTGLPDSYDTILSRVFAAEPGSNGAQLSGGQWQRLAVARGMFRGDRELMILDEPSSGLDPAAEHDLHERLRGLRRGRTSLLISHRLGAVRDADHIVVLAGGRVAEQGDHESLLAAGGRYASLFQLQAGPYATAGLGDAP